MNQVNHQAVEEVLDNRMDYDVEENNILDDERVHIIRQDGEHMVISMPDEVWIEEFEEAMGNPSYHEEIAGSA